MKRAIILFLTALTILLSACARDDMVPPPTGTMPPSADTTQPPTDAAPIPVPEPAVSGSVFLPNGGIPDDVYAPHRPPERYYADTVLERILYNWIQTTDGQNLVRHEGYATAG